MSYDILSTSSINNLIESFKSNETTKSITPLTAKKTKYQNLSNAYTVLNSKLFQLKLVASDFKLTGTSSAFSGRSASVSNSSFLTAVASSSAAKSAYTLRVNQLAKSDIVTSEMLTSGSANSITAGTHKFVIKTGDGSTGEYTSNVEVDVTATETNLTLMEKIRNAINSDFAIVKSTAYAASDAYTGGDSTFKINLNGTETSVSIAGGGTYSDLMDELVSKINANISGVTAEKITDSGNVSLKLVVKDQSKYISVNHDSGTTDLVSQLGINVQKEKAAAATVTASVFSPGTGNAQFSITTKESGLDYRIKSIYDQTGNSALQSLGSATTTGLNLGTTRTEFDQNTNTAGYVFADITSTGNLLNSKLEFNNISIQRNSNTISDLAAGITFTLKSVMQETDQDISVTTGNDIAGIKGKIQSFIAKFNDVYSYLKTNSSYSSGNRGFFISDRNTSTLMSDLKSSVLSQVSGLSDGDLSLLSQVGISFDSTTGLTISNNTILEQNIIDNLSELENLFNSNNGIANLIYSKIDPYLGAVGYLANTKSSFESNITLLNDKIKRNQVSIDKGADVLRRKYEQMQAQLAAMITLQNMLFSGGSV